MSNPGMRRLLALIGLSVSLVVVVPVAAEACTCAPQGPPCQEVWESPVIFAGTVIEVEQPGPHFQTRARFRITEAFRGTEAGEIDIHLRGGGSASCDPEFKVGESWLVYGHNQWEGGPGWTTSSCSRTRLLENAQEDLAYLRLPDKEKPTSHIAGRVARYVYEPYPGTGGDSVGIANVPVIVTRGDTRLETTTDSEGRYKVDVQPGEYYVAFEAVDDFNTKSGRFVSVPHYRTCAIADGGVRFGGTVVGQVVDDAGMPAAFLPVQIASTVQRRLEHTLTDAAGRFEFRVHHQPPHEIAVSVDLWPAVPDVPPLTREPLPDPRGGILDAGQLRLPEAIKLALVELIIVDSTGKPASGARVSFRQPTIRNATSYDPSPRADENGRFLVSLIAGERYEVIVGYTRETPTESEIEEAFVTIETPARGPIRIRLKPWQRGRLSP